MAKKEKVAKVAKTVTAKVAKAAKTVKAAMTDKKNVITPADAKIPAGPLAEKWTNYKTHQKLVNPANKRRLDVIVVGTGLAGASAAASLAELGFNVLNFCIQDSPRRAHSIAAQGGINAAKNYKRMVTLLIASSTIQLKAVISLVKPMFTVWLKFPIVLSINV